MSDPDYRYCKYCGTDCDDFPGLKPDHSQECPFETGLFPVSAQDMRDQLQCMDCDVPFKPGDYWVQVREDQDVAQIVCIGCGMLEAISHGG